MEYAPGGNLADLVNDRRRIPNDIIRSYAAEVILALEELHANKIIYRDLKAENIVLDKDGHCLLTDFGVSKKLVGKRTQSFDG